MNGHSGTFYLHPKLSYSRSDFLYAFDPHESDSTIHIDVPVAFLNKGENTVSITCIDDPPTKSGEEEIGGISYDAIALFEGASAQQPHAQEVSAEVEPTIFYRQDGAGLTEVVDAFIRFPRAWPAGDVDLEIGGKHSSAKLSGGEFGEERVSFESRVDGDGAGQASSSW